MMNIGVSTSCYYPLKTELALKKIASLDIKICEVFINSYSEIEKPFLHEIRKIKDDYGISIPSIHPFLSFGEPYLLFSEYERRFEDGIKYYKKYFEAANFLGSKILVMHGGKNSNYVNDELYFERFAKLIEEGKQYDVIVAQENVVHYRSQSPEFLTGMKKYIGNDFKIVLDLKQAARAGYSAFEFVRCLPDSIAHIHISDRTNQEDCLPPGEGDFDFVRLISEMEALNYQGNYIIELYRHNFEQDSQIIDAKNYIERLGQIL